MMTEKGKTLAVTKGLVGQVEGLVGKFPPLCMVKIPCSFTASFRRLFVFMIALPVSVSVIE